MTHIQRLDRKISITLKSGDWDLLTGFVTAQRNMIRDENKNYPTMARPEYLKTLERIRFTLIERNP